jgi:hypothetical protein
MNNGVTLLFLFSGIFAQRTFAFSCMRRETDTCIKMKVEDEGYSVIASLLHFRPSCMVIIREEESNRKWEPFYLKKCTGIKGPAYLHVKYTCDLGFPWELKAAGFDTIKVMTEKECEPILARRSKFFLNLKSIKPGTLMSEMDKFGLSGRVMQAHQIWEYQASPKFKVFIKVSEMCGESVCTDPKVQKFERIKEVHDYDTGITNEPEPVNSQ